jgi:hypothetical protein
VVGHPNGYAAFQPSTVSPLHGLKLVRRLMFTGLADSGHLTTVHLEDTRHG